MTHSQPGQAGTKKDSVICNYSVSRKILNKTIKKFLTCHFERSEKSSASKILRMHKISPSGRDDIFFIYVMNFGSGLAGLGIGNALCSIP